MLGKAIRRKFLSITRSPQQVLLPDGFYRSVEDGDLYRFEHMLAVEVRPGLYRVETHCVAVVEWKGQRIDQHVTETLFVYPYDCEMKVVGE